MKLYQYWRFLGILLAGIPLMAGNYQVNQMASEVAVDAKASPPHTFTSAVRDYAYDIEINPDTLEVSRAEFRFNFADMDSEETSRDKKMCKWMDIAVHPEARFILNQVVEKDGQTIGVGTFYMHGVGREIEVPFTVRREGEDVILDGGTSFDYKDWDLKLVRLLIFTVKPELQPHFHLVGKLEPTS